MHHSYRRFHVTDLDRAEALVELLASARNPPPRCSGYRLPSSAGPLLFLCDDGYDTRVEYAVFDEEAHQQIESVTFGCCDERSAQAIVSDLLARRNTVRIRSRFPVLEHDDYCPHCAGAVALEEAL